MATRYSLPDRRVQSGVSFSSTSNTVLSGTAGKRINVCALVLTLASAQTVTIKSGTTTLATFPNCTILTLDARPEGYEWFKTAAGDDLVIDLGSAVEAGGTLEYQLEDVE